MVWQEIYYRCEIIYHLNIRKLDQNLLDRMGQAPNVAAIPKFKQDCREEKKRKYYKLFYFILGLYEVKEVIF